MAVINGGPGQWLPGTNGSDTINAYGDNNSLFGASEANERGDTGPNTLIVHGGSHNTLVGTIAADHFDGGSGIDNTASYQLSPNFVTASLANPSINTGDAAGDTYSNIYQLTGSLSGSILYGDTSGKANQLWALGGTNTLNGATGYTVFISGPGADRMVGGSGRGLVDYEEAESAITASLRNSAINTGEAAGDVYSDIADLAGSQFSDVLHGDDNANNFLGGHSNDRGNDVFFGYGGSDTFTSGQGADTMHGGSGGDLFVFTADDVTDARSGLLNVIADYNQGNRGTLFDDEYDKVGVTHLNLSSSTVRVLADRAGGFSTVQASIDGSWLSIARLDGITAGDQVRILIQDSNPFGIVLAAQASETATTNSKLGSHGTAWPISGVGDFDADGQDDILWRNPSTGQVDQWRMDDGQWSRSIDLGATKPADWKLAGVGDFDGDGTSDVLWRETTTSKVDQWHMENGNWAGSIDHGATKGVDWEAAGVGDFNGDGVSDVLWRKVDTAQVDQWEMKGGNWSKSIDLGATKGLEWALSGVGDFNGDGVEDVLWRNVSTAQVDQWQMRDGNWSRSVDHGSTKGNDWTIAGIGDFDGDGTDDILWFNTRSGQLEHWIMRDGNWAQSIDDGIQSTTLQAAGVGDIDGNGRDDVLWVDTSSADAFAWNL